MHKAGRHLVAAGGSKDFLSATLSLRTKNEVRDFRFIRRQIINELDEASVICLGSDLESEISDRSRAPLIVKARDLDEVPVSLMGCRQRLGNDRETAGSILPPNMLTQIPFPGLDNPVDEQGNCFMFAVLSE